MLKWYNSLSGDYLSNLEIQYERLLYSQIYIILYTTYPCISTTYQKRDDFLSRFYYTILKERGDDKE